MLEDGGIAARGSHAELLERLAAVPRDRREGPAGQRVPDAQAARAQGGGTVRPRAAELRRRLRGTRGRGRRLRGLAALLAPYRGRVALMLVSLVLGTAASLAPAPLAKLAIDDGIIPAQPAPPDADRGRVRRRRARRVGARPPRRPTSSSGSASARSPTCASRSSTTCSGCRSASTSAGPPAS